MYAPEYDMADETTRADRLPKDFGNDHPDVIRLKAVRAEREKEANDLQKMFSDFDSWRFERIGELERAACEIAEIDRRRPQLLADIFSGDRDFTPDDEAQDRRAELQVQIDRFNLAMPLLNNQRVNKQDQVQAAHQRLYLACQDVDALLAKLRQEHVRR
jgi:hypothetical protein